MIRRFWNAARGASSDMGSTVQGSWNAVNQQCGSKTHMMGSKLRVLFMQSQAFFGSDSMIHSLIMRHLNRERLEVHVACNPRDGTKPSPSSVALQNLPDVQFRATNFGPSVNGHSLTALAEELPSTVPGSI